MASLLKLNSVWRIPGFFRAAMADSTFVFWEMQRDQLPPSWPQAEERLKAASA